MHAWKLRSTGSCRGGRPCSACMLHGLLAAARRSSFRPGAAIRDQETVIQTGVEENLNVKLAVPAWCVHSINYSQITIQPSAKRINPGRHMRSAVNQACMQALPNLAPRKQASRTRPPLPSPPSIRQRQARARGRRRPTGSGSNRKKEEGGEEKKRGAS
jgi:hypothetical protein